MEYRSRYLLLEWLNVKWSHSAFYDKNCRRCAMVLHEHSSVFLQYYYHLWK